MCRSARHNIGRREEDLSSGCLREVQIIPPSAPAKIPNSAAAERS